MIAALLLAQAVVGPAAPPAEPREQMIFLTWDARAKACVPQVNGVDTGDIATPAGKAAFAAALPDKGATLRVLDKGRRDLPYECAVRLVDELRDGGYYGPILHGLTAAPPPPPMEP